ncbi:52 kDa repressor of the inhibitor of the protein kinase-like [Diretmus argenteus]
MVKGGFSFITKGFTDWKNAVGEKRGILPKHSLSITHQKATEMAENYTSIVEGKKKDISSRISAHYEEKVRRNHQTLLSILDVIVCLGQRNIAFRGRWDSEGGNETGNFHHFIDWKAEFDSTLKRHLQTAPKNAMYLSPRTQNELIQCCADDIRETLLTKVKEAKFFSVLADESMDISGTEQMSICIRYVSDKDKSTEIREDFLGFCPLPKQDAATISEAILRQLTEMNLDPSFLRGQGYDGASTMSGHVSGVRTRIQEQYPRAVYTHCRSHALNLVVVHGCADIPVVRNTMTIIEKIAVFFSATGARKAALQEQCTAAGDQPRTRTAGIPLMSDTRWGTRATTLCAFVDKFSAVHSALSTMETEHNSISGKAFNLRQSMESFETIITAVITNYVLGYMQPLTKQLQATNLDILSAYQEARNVREVIAQERCEEGFSVCFEKATALANSVDVVPTKRRISVKQSYRANSPSETVEDHYRVNLFYPFIDHLLSELDGRFAERNEPAMVAAYLVPAHLTKLTKEMEAELIQWHQPDLPDSGTVEQELKRWRHKFSTETLPLPTTALDTLHTTNMSYFPNVECMLRIYLTIPVTTCACERPFSAMRRLKTWLRASMSDNRLSGLALMHVHPKVRVDRERVLRRWDASGHRRIHLAFETKT